MGDLSFPKSEKLCSRTVIDLLFQKGSVIRQFPINVFHMPTEVQARPLAVLIAAPKKRVRKATDRNRVKRLIREAYRLQRNALLHGCAEANVNIALAIVHVGKADPDSAQVNRSMAAVLQQLETIYLKEKKHEEHP